MTAVYQHYHAVVREDIDELNHANNLAYLTWCLDAAAAHTALLGWPSERYLELGAAWVVRAHAIKYLQSALEGEEIIVFTWISDLRKFSSTRRYEIVRTSDGALLSTASTEWAFIDLASGGLTRIPDEISQALPVLPVDTVRAQNA